MGLKILKMALERTSALKTHAVNEYEHGCGNLALQNNVQMPSYSGTIFQTVRF
jgi:hypothetical protein